MGKKIETYLGALFVGDSAFQLLYFFLDMYGRGQAVNDLLHAPIFAWLANPKAPDLSHGVGQPHKCIGRIDPIWRGFRMAHRAYDRETIARPGHV
jgi:hypothetical protein